MLAKALIPTKVTVSTLSDRIQSKPNRCENNTFHLNQSNLLLHGVDFPIQPRGHLSEFVVINIPPLGQVALVQDYQKVIEVSEADAALGA
jgi:hypothetical protein